MSKYNYPLYLTYQEWREGGDIIDPSDRWSDREPEHINFVPTGLLVERNNAGIFPQGLMEDEVFGEFSRGDIGYTVIVRYETGDTFGYSTGNWYLVGVYKNLDEAFEIKEKIQNATYEGYKPWIGYFERFESVEIHTLAVQ